MYKSFRNSVLEKMRKEYCEELFAAKRTERRSEPVVEEARVMSQAHKAALARMEKQVSVAASIPVSGIFTSESYPELIWGKCCPITKEAMTEIVHRHYRSVPPVGDSLHNQLSTSELLLKLQSVAAKYAKPNSKKVPAVKQLVASTELQARRRVALFLHENKLV